MGNNMESWKTTGLVARYTNYQDYDRMITLVTSDFGRVDLIARGCRKQGSQLMACTQLFAYGEFVLSKRGERYSLTQAALLESFYDLRFDLDKLTAASTVVDTLSQAASPGEPCGELFSLAYYALSFLCYGGAPTSDLMICYLLKYLEQQGYRPSTTRCSRCGQSTFERPRFHATYGALCAQCALQKGGAPISPLSLEAMRRMLLLPLETMDNVRLPEDVRADIRTALPPYFQNHTGGLFRASPYFTAL